MVGGRGHGGNAHGFDVKEIIAKIGFHQKKIMEVMWNLGEAASTPSVYQKSDILVFSGLIKRSANFHRST